MCKCMRYPSVFLVLLLVAVTTAVLAADAGGDKKVSALVISNNGVKDAKLLKDDVANIFLGKKSTFSDKSKIVFVTLAKGKTHENFLKTYLSKTPSQFANYWKKQVFTGKAKAPKAFKTEKELVDFVAKTKGAIGYISPATAKDAKIMQDEATRKDKVKTVTIAKKKK